jgi:hypothetical protein
MIAPARVEILRRRHQYCQDGPAPIEDYEEARLVQSDHAGHGPGCLQYTAAQARTSQALA